MSAMPAVFLSPSPSACKLAAVPRRRTAPVDHHSPLFRCACVSLLLWRYRSASFICRARTPRALAHIPVFAFGAPPAAAARAPEVGVCPHRAPDCDVPCALVHRSPAFVGAAV